MLFGSHKKKMQDKEAGLIFDWRHYRSKRLPLIVFLFVALIVHFFVFKLFSPPKFYEGRRLQEMGRIFVLNDELRNKPENAALYAQMRKKNKLPLRFSEEHDPLSRGIDQLLHIPLTAGMRDWSPSLHEYNSGMLSSTDLYIKNIEFFPKVDERFLQKTEVETVSNEPIQIVPQIVEAAPSLSAVLPKRLPSWKESDVFTTMRMGFMVSVSPEGRIVSLLPLEEVADRDMVKLSERWIRAIPWMPSLTGANGVLFVEWKGDRK